MKKKLFNFYCDESTHLENDGQKYMLISYVSCAYPQLAIHKEAIKNIKKKHRMVGEIKWSNVSASNIRFYENIIDYFFATDLTFRTVIIEKSQINNEVEGISYDDFYYKMYNELIRHKIDSSYNYNIYLDIKDTCSQDKLRALESLLNTAGNIRNIQFMRSYESVFMQISDLIMGAINYSIRNLNQVMAKNSLIDRIKKHSALSLTNSTSKEADKFNIYYIDLR